MMKIREDGGFSTLGMVVALLVSLSLVFTAAQVCRISSASAAIQDVADASALAAQNQVAEFVVVAKVCDAVVLSLTLTSFASASLGVVCLCTPATAQLSAQLLEISKKILDARNSFADKASQGLDSFQRLLPFLAAVHAAQVAKANGGGPSDHSYLAIAVLSPDEGKEIVPLESDKAKALLDDAEGKADEVRKRAEEAEEAAKEAGQAKEAAFERDCGANPGYCLYERAESLAGLSGYDNPLYSSVDSWSFEVALDRSKKYYAARLANEQPLSATVDEQAKSALRKRFYEYAVETVGKGYVHDDGLAFEADFPRLPRNTNQMKETSLYVEAGYPITGSDDDRMMHAWEGCPSAAGATSVGSIQQMDAGKFKTCPDCGFSVQSMGKVAEASSSIDNGFEYHYLKIADEAARYQDARNKERPAAKDVQDQAETLLENLREAFKEVANKRIEVHPPGSSGVVALAVDTAQVSSSNGFETAFVQGSSTLGVRAAVSGATLVADPSDEGSNVISSLLDGVKEKSGTLASAPGVVLDCWSNMLGAYANGQDEMVKGLRTALDAIPLASASGLGTWAANRLTALLEDFGLEPMNLDAVKPVLVNTSYVVKGDAGSFAGAYAYAKDVSLRSGSYGGLFAMVVAQVKEMVMSRLEGPIEIATIYPVGEGGPEIPLTVELPQSFRDAAGETVSSLIYGMRDVLAGGSDQSIWQ